MKPLSERTREVLEFDLYGDPKPLECVVALAKFISSRKDVQAALCEAVEVLEMWTHYADETYAPTPMKMSREVLNKLEQAVASLEGEKGE